MQELLLDIVGTMVKTKTDRVVQLHKEINPRLLVFYSDRQLVFRYEAELLEADRVDV